MPGAAPSATPATFGKRKDMNLRNQLRIAFLLALFLLTGCSSIFTHTSDSGGPIVYRGTRHDIKELVSAPYQYECIPHEVTVLACFIDLPFSFVVDTLCLPYDIYKAATTYSLSDVERNPNLLHELIVAIAQRPLSSRERMIIWQMVWKPGAVRDTDIPVLLDFFKSDQSALAGIITKQNVTVDQLRLLYDRNKDAAGYNRVLDELATHPLTPDDVLRGLLTQRDGSLVEKARQRLNKE